MDKVVLHALVDNILYGALTKSFIRDSHASQTGKGTDDGLMRLQKPTWWTITAVRATARTAGC